MTLNRKSRLTKELFEYLDSNPKADFNAIMTSDFGQYICSIFVCLNIEEFRRDIHARGYVNWLKEEAKKYIRFSRFLDGAKRYQATINEGRKKTIENNIFRSYVQDDTLYPFLPEENLLQKLFRDVKHYVPDRVKEIAVDTIREYLQTNIPEHTIKFESELRKIIQSRTNELDIETRRDDPRLQRLYQHVEKNMEILNPEEKEVLQLHFGLENGKTHSLENIGKKKGVSGNCIRNKRDRALGKLRREWRNYLHPDV